MNFKDIDLVKIKASLKKRISINKILPSFIIFLISVILVSSLHFLRVFDILELKMHDLKFNIRGSLSATGNWNKWPLGEDFVDGNNQYDKGEKFEDSNGNGKWDAAEKFIDEKTFGTFIKYGNGRYDEGEKFEDSNSNGKWDAAEPFTDQKNGVYDKGESFTDIGNGIYDSGEVFIDSNMNKVWDPAESYIDFNGNGQFDGYSAEEFTDSNGNGKWDLEEDWEDFNGNGQFDEYKAEDFTDSNGNGKWDAAEKFIDSGNGKWDKGLDVVIVYEDDDSYEALTELYPDPYPRGEVWGKAIENLVMLGAEVIVIDYVFDAHDPSTVAQESIRNKWGDPQSLDFEDNFPIYDGDKALMESILKAEKDSVTVILSARIGSNPNSTDYNKLIAPSKTISKGTIYPKYGMVDIAPDSDDFVRTYPVFWPQISERTEDGKIIPKFSLALEAVLAKYGYDSDKIQISFKEDYNPETKELTISDIVIPTYGSESSFMLNLYGPSSFDLGISSPFKSYSLKTILDDDSICFGECDYQGESFIDLNGNGQCDDCIAQDKLHDKNWNDQWDEGEDFDDCNGNGVYDPPADLFIIDEDDDNGNGIWDEGEYYEDYNKNDQYDPPKIESFEDSNCNGVYDPDLKRPVKGNEIDDNWIEQYTDKRNENYKFFGPNKSPFKGKIVILGTALKEDHDTQSVPLMSISGNSYPMPGVDIHANAIQQILHKSYIQSDYGEINLNSEKTNWWNHVGLISLLSFITIILVSSFATFGSTLTAILLILFWFNFSVGQFVQDFFWFFDYMFGDWDSRQVALSGSNMIPTVFPMLSIFIPYGVNLSYKLYTENKDKKFLKNTFGNYISSELVDQMYESKEIPELGGKEGYHTLIFSDVASFSSFSEAMTAPQLVELLNEYLTAMTQIILDNGGTVDKYIGDAIVAFYGAPVDVEDHENKAMLTVIQMNAKLDELREKWRSEGDKWPDLVKNMQHRVGINTGYLVTGNMGSELQMNYTCMGDTVNLAARLESGSKQWGIDAQVAQSVYDKTKDNFVFRKLGGIRVKGKTEPVNVYELLCQRGNEPEGLYELLGQFDSAMELYLKQDWDNAIKAFEESDKLEDMSGPRDTNPSRTYIKICSEFKDNPPGDDWDGVYTFKTK